MLASSSTSTLRALPLNGLRKSSKVYEYSINGKVFESFARKRVFESPNDEKIFELSSSRARDGGQSTTNDIDDDTTTSDDALETQVVKLDWFFLILFPILFLIFNIVYWTTLVLIEDWDHPIPILRSEKKKDYLFDLHI